MPIIKHQIITGVGVVVGRITAVGDKRTTGMTMWKFRHWLTGRLLAAALVTMPESAAKDLLCSVIGEWGRYVRDALREAHP